jgi:hypothetical protein
MSFNTFKSTHIYGEFVNEDSPDASLTASASFQRDVYLGGNLVVPGPDGPVSLSPAQLIQLTDLDQTTSYVTQESLDAE